MKRISEVDRPDGRGPAVTMPEAKRRKTDTQPVKLTPPHQGAPLPERVADFMSKAAIGAFDRQNVQLPRQHRSYNDDVRVEAYEPPAMAYADKQRRGIHENLESCESTREHVSRALREPFPLSVETPLPQDTLDAAVFSRDCPPDRLRAFWANQLGRLEKLVQDSELAQRKWDSAVPDGITTAAGKLKTVALSQLMRQCGLGGQKWILQFANGFPITGELAQRHAYKLSEKHQNGPSPRLLIRDSLGTL